MSPREDRDKFLRSFMTGMSLLTLRASASRDVDEDMHCSSSLGMVDCLHPPRYDDGQE